MDDRVVVDTGPLIALARAEILDLMGRLSFQFFCPGEVRKEAVRPIVDKLSHEGIWYDNGLIRRVLAELGE